MTVKCLAFNYMVGHGLVRAWLILSFLAFNCRVGERFIELLEMLICSKKQMSSTLCAQLITSKTHLRQLFLVFMLTNRILVGLDRTWQVQVSKSRSE